MGPALSVARIVALALQSAPQAPAVVPPAPPPSDDQAPVRTQRPMLAGVMAVLVRSGGPGVTGAPSSDNPLPTSGLLGSVPCCAPKEETGKE